MKNGDVTTNYYTIQKPRCDLFYFTSSLWGGGVASFPRQLTSSLRTSDVARSRAPREIITMLQDEPFFSFGVFIMSTFRHKRLATKGRSIKTFTSFIFFYAPPPPPERIFIDILFSTIECCVGVCCLLLWNIPFDWLFAMSEYI